MTDEKNDLTSSEQVETLNLDKVNQIVNQAISNRFKSFERKFEEFTTKLTAPQEEPKKDEKLSNTELVNLKKQLESIQKERDNEVSKRKDTELRTSVKETLLKSGIAPNMIKAAMAVLVDSDKVVGYDEDDQIVFKTQNGNMDINSGLREWTKTEEGKSFVAARGVQGSGEKSFGKPNKSTTPELSRAEVGEYLKEALLGGRYKD